MLHHWTERGVTWHLVPYANDEKGIESVLKLATFALEKQLADIAKSQAKSLATAAEKHGVGSRRYDQAANRIVIRNQRLIEAAERAASGFGLQVNSTDARRAVLGLQAVAQTQAAIYNGITESLPVPGNPVTPEVLTKEVEHATGQDLTVERSAFTPPTPTLGVSPPETPAQPTFPADRCPRCGAALTAPKYGRAGRFRGCVRFPLCRGLRPCR
jgi:hypothetical protein